MRIEIKLVAVVACFAAASPAWADDAGEAPTPRERAFGERVQAIHDRSGRAGTLRERLAFSDYFDVDERGAPLVRERLPLEALVDSARGESDPVVLQLLLHRCLTAKAKGRCDTVAVARRWTDVDGLNQVAWLGLAAAHRAEGDPEGARAASIRAADAPAWRSGFTSVWRALAGDLPRGLAPAERLALLAQRSAVASLVQLDATMSLNQLCRLDDADMRRACTLIIETMARDGDTLMEAYCASAFAGRRGFDAQRQRELQRRSDALQWAFLQSIPTSWSRDDETADTPAVRADLARVDALLLEGERRFMERRLAASAVTESDAATLYVATLSPEAARARADRARPRP